MLATVPLPVRLIAAQLTGSPLNAQRASVSEAGTESIAFFSRML